ncbi:hypothetical protein GCM10010145_43640 [Streptomyces ruber]|uniref:HPr kinase/phosphorylase C-terminal domain-containing protein n=2 Tax=Streptomyces TaxID=1883 RepID=A0A918BHE7_9ACTN|nr:hypothetical protein [Streptomyces ruber]GGQ69163.1 hypothetical protein GCM10010145_43640 [Streptomyces ruber]
MALPSLTRITWHDLEFRVRAEDHGVLDYVESQHRLARAEPGPAGTRIDIAAVSSPSRLGELAARPATEHRESYAGWWYGCHRREDGAFVLVSGEGHEFSHALITADFLAWEIIAAHEHELGLVVTRTMRELVREHFVRRGALMLHGAAAVLPDGTGVVLAGPSGAGKTSASVQLARSGGYCVATDRCLLLADGPAWVVVGLPLSTRLTQEAAAGLGIEPGEKSRLIRHGEAAVRRPDPKNKISLSNEEMRRLAGVEFVASARIDGLVLLENTGADAPHSSPVPGADAVAALAEHILVPDTAYRGRWLSADPSPEPAGDVKGRIGELAAAVPARRGAWTPATYGRDVLAAWLAPRAGAETTGDPS